MSKKKVLILGKLPPPFMGPAIATQIILNSRLRNSFQLLHHSTKVNESLNMLGKWNFEKIIKNFTIYINLLKVCILEKPDLVLIPISQTTIGFIKDSFLIIIARLTGRKILIQLRGSNFINWLSNSTWLTKVIVGFILSLAKGVIVLGQNLKYLFTDYFPSEKIFVVPNGADYSFPVVVKIAQRPVRILYLSNLLKSKGITDVFDALVILKQKNIPFRFEAIGEWLELDIKQYCIALVEQYQLPVDIYPSLGKTEKLSHLAFADIFIFPPRDPEGHPWVIVEALAAGLPVISTNQGAIAESVYEGVNGFIIPPSNAVAIAEKLFLLIHDLDLRSKMAFESRRIYFENFTEDKMTANLEKVFNSIIHT